jgi:broad specificity phosphatase PhoE
LKNIVENKMPENHLILMKHAKTQVVNTKPISEWDLAEEGLGKLKSLLTHPVFSKVGVIIASTENKAQKTASYFAQKKGLPIHTYDELRELNRDKGPFLTLEEYNNTVQKLMQKPTQSFHNWETAENALNRFKLGIDIINNKYHKKIILIVSHGIVINLFLASIRKQQNTFFTYWSKMDFCDYIVVKNSVIIKDIT